MKRILLLLVIGVCFAFAAKVGFSQTIGVIDTAKIMSDSPLAKSVFKEIDDQTEIYRKEIEIRKRIKFLNETEVKELISTADAARIKELESINTSRSDELNALNQKNPLNDTEKARQADLRAQAKKSDENLQNVAKGFDKSMDEFFKQKQELVDEKLLTATKAVAEEKGLSIVIQKISVAYGGIDITAEVMAKLPASL